MMDVVTLKRRQGDRLVASELRASRFFPAKAYDEATGAFLCDDGTVGFCFACTPLPGADEQTEQRLELMLNQGWPDGAMMQFFLWRSPDIAGPLAAMRALRQGAACDGAPEAAAAAAVFAERLRFLSEHAARPLVARTRAGAAWDAGRVVDVKLAVT
ncbi:MAG: TraC family protein, partial [Duodenibacillus sp.]|nr:TraC family protein [Duodenibacillus sp.]